VSASCRALGCLERQWAWLAALGGVLLAAVSCALAARFSFDAAVRWGIPAAVVLAWFFLRLRKSLELNHPPDDPALHPTLGAANRLTIARAALTASLAGFLLPSPVLAAHAAWGWLPGLVYLSATAMDYVDGHLARRTNRVTRLGAYLDTQVDALGLLLVGLLLVAGAKAPLAYLGVGLGYYLLQAAIRLRRAAGRSVRPVPPRPGARWVAGCEMVFAALALLPLFTPQATRPAAWVMALALAISLGQDWRILSGAAPKEGPPRPSAPSLAARGLARGLPLFLRAAAAAGWMWILLKAPAEIWDGGVLPLKAAVLAGAVLCVLGVAARAAAMLLSLLGALWVLPFMPGGAAAVTLMASLSLMLTGAGRPRIGQPEDRFLLGRNAASGA
jgi:CDP-diacylglycerol--glycerol-3-phosphate 3-phosphatidyltransferase